MAMQEPMMQEDVKAVEETSGVEKIPGLGKSKGEMSFPERRAKAAKVAMSKEMGRGIPKRWKGRGDYYFEQLDDGGLKITGGDSAKSLTGGKSTVIRDSSEIRRIFEAARGGDIVEEGAMYQGGGWGTPEQIKAIKGGKDILSDDLYNKEELGEMMQNVQQPAYDSKEELGEMMQNVQQPAYDSKAELAEMMIGQPEPEEEDVGISDLRGTPGGLRPTRTVGQDVMGKVQDLLTRTSEEAERLGDSEMATRLKNALSMLGIG